MRPLVTASRSTLTVGAVSAAILMGGSCLTQTARAAESQASVPEEITVTARRRVERIEDVPISLTALGSDQLASRQIDNTKDLGHVVPNLQFSPVAPSSGNSSSAAIFIRGVGQADFIASTDPGVGFYVDGVYFARASGTAVSLLDVDHIEVLRGPQGTLFGRNTVGGAIQVITKKPQLGEFGGRVAATVGKFERRDVDATLNLPIGETFAMRLAATHRQRDGYVERIFDGLDLGDVDTDAARLSALWKPSDDFDLLLAVDYTSDDSNGSPTVFGGIATTVPPASFVRLAAINAGCPGVTATAVPENNDPRCPNNQWLALGPYKTASTAPLRSELKMYGSTLTASWNPIEDLTLRSISAYRRTKPFSMRDGDNTPQLVLATINRDDLKQFSQELQFLGDAIDDRLHWQMGLYYFRESDHQFYPVYLPSSIVNGAETQVGGLNSASDILNKSYAAFTQETFDITDKLNVTAGLRYTVDKKEITPHMFASPSVHGYTNVGYRVPNPAPLTGIVCLGATSPSTSPPCTGPTDTMFAQALNKKKDTSLTPMLSVQYRWTPELMTYASYAEGFKSGGMNTRIIQPVVSEEAPTGREFLPQFDPEKVKSFEVGAKAMLFSSLRLSAAAFHAKYDDTHIIVREGAAPVVRNAGKATIRGVETEWNWDLAGLEVSGGLGYTDFKYDSFTAQLNASQAALAPHAVGRVDLDDNQAYTPKWNATLGVSYRLQTDFGAITPRVDGAYRSKTYFDPANTEQIAQPNYTVYNASLRYLSSSERWSVTAGVTNLTDKQYRVSGNQSLAASAGYAEVVYAPPRQYFVQGTYEL